MPNPIVILSHHYRSSHYEFILDNLPLLKRQGYTKLLYELNSETSLESFKQESRKLLSSTFPGLAFFSVRNGEKKSLYVPKLNLPENRSILEEAFVSHGVMRK